MLQLQEKYSPNHKFPSGGILLLDSGVGALSISREIKKVLPQVPILSLGDQKFFPYGSKSEEFLSHRVDELLKFALEEFKPAVLVIACNTASTCLLSALREKYDIPIVGVVPPIKPAAEYSKTRSLMILSTEATSQRSYLDCLVRDFAADCEVIKVGCKSLAALAEESVAGRVVTLKEISEDLHNHLDFFSEVDSLVLGCTHFSVFYQELQEILGSNVKIFDPSKAVARQVFRVCKNSVEHQTSLSWHLTTCIKSSLSTENIKMFGIDQVYSI